MVVPAENAETVESELAGTAELGQTAGAELVEETAEVFLAGNPSFAGAAHACNTNKEK